MSAKADKTGSCSFCGQTKIIQVPEEWEQGQILLYCHANFGSPDNQTQLLASYDAMCTKIKGGGYHREANKTID